MIATSIGHAGILIETSAGSILCDPWFEPAFFASWFVYPRNDRLPVDLVERIEDADHLYVSHLHGDHFDEQWLRSHLRRDIPVLLPGFPTREMERRMRGLGFTNFVRTVDGEELDLGRGLTVAVHVETSITDGPGGDSALVVSSGGARLVNQNDCRTAQPADLRVHGPVDLHWLQYSGAIWYPMVYDEPAERMRELVDAKVESQFTRAIKYVEAIDARAVVPSAGPPCFLDPELFHLNVIDGDELSIFPDQAAFLARLRAAGRTGMLAIPGTSITVSADHAIGVRHPLPMAEVDAIFSSSPSSSSSLAASSASKRDYLQAYQADWLDWIDRRRAEWHPPTVDLLQTLQFWWGPLLALAPTLRSAIGAACVLDLGDLKIVIDFEAGEVRHFAGDEHGFRFQIQRELVETVVAARAVDWSNALFLSCRFRAWRDGPFNEYLYNFFKSLSVERMRRAESEARRKLDPPDPSEEIRIGDFLLERTCPHRQADLSVFGEIDKDVLTCTLHGWRFDVTTGRCLTATDRKLRIRRADHCEPVAAVAVSVGFAAPADR